ncbi:hypothetical protein QJQ45_027314 [Haematococcus lacustris]|nr:hypothetical protein QJQ45_027314 [Haematococcus lacustris]
MCARHISDKASTVLEVKASSEPLHTPPKAEPGVVNLHESPVKPKLLEKATARRTAHRVMAKKKRKGSDKKQKVLCKQQAAGLLDKEYPELGYKRVRDKPLKTQQQQQQPAGAQEPTLDFVFGRLFPQMERYVYRRRNDGIYVINLEKTYEKMQLAARIIVAIENSQDVMVQSARPYGQRAVFKFAQYLNCKYSAGRHTPGTFTNQIQKNFEEPRLLLLTER